MSTTSMPGALAAARDGVIRCELCPRLRAYCRGVAREKKAAHRDDTYWGRPVPGFGDPQARVLVVGLAPAAHGANRTGRVFTGDGSGDFLMRAMHDNGFANIPTARRADDGLALTDAYILAVVRCAPPDNKPLPIEITRCRVHLRAEIGALPRLRVVIALGKIAWDGYLAYLRAIDAETASAGNPRDAGHAQHDVGDDDTDQRRAGGGAESRLRPPARPAFGHGAEASFGSGRPLLLGSYHPSRQNTNTGKLTAAMLSAVFARARQLIQSGDRDGDHDADSDPEGDGNPDRLARKRSRRTTDEGPRP